MSSTKEGNAAMDTAARAWPLRERGRVPGRFALPRTEGEERDDEPHERHAREDVLPVFLHAGTRVSKVPTHTALQLRTGSR